MPRAKTKSSGVRDAHAAEKKHGKTTIASLHGGRVQSRRQRARGLRNRAPKCASRGGRRDSSLGRQHRRSDT
jgi:hypothetical protein